MIRNSHTSMDYISPSYSTNTKINKTTTQPRKGNNLRLSLRRFSHHGAGTANRQSTRNETGIYNSTIPILDLEIYPWSRCQEEILKLAQGEKLDSKERTKLAVSIRNITYGSRNLAELILTDLFVASSIQEAFKQLATNFDQNSSLELDGISKLWIQFYDTILPTLHSVLYPFEESTSCNIRKAILTAFRDGVVLDPDLSYGTLCNTTDITQHATVGCMLLILEQTTRDDSSSYTKLETLCSKLITDFGSWPIPAVYNHSDNESISSNQTSPTSQNLSTLKPHVSKNSLTSIQQADQLSPVNIKYHEHRSASPLARVKQALLYEIGGGILRRHSYTPGSN